MARGASALVPAPARSNTIALLQLGLVVLLGYASVRIAMPFVAVMAWAMILAVMLYPLHLRLKNRLGNSGSAWLIGVVTVVALLGPTIMLVTSLASSAGSLVSGIQNNTLVLPPPPAKLADLPVIGQKLFDAWALLSANMPAAIAKYGSTLKGAISWLLGFTGRLASAELQFVLSFIIAAIFVAYGESLTGFARRLLSIITQSQARGAHLVSLTGQTIRGVATGVVGVAGAQAILVGVGFFAVGLPGAGLLTLVVFLLGIIQVPATLLTLPIIAYVFANEPTGTAIIFAIWSLVAGLSDNVLKPIMLGRGMEVPMPVILIGVIGGMIADGLLGLFIGPVILAIAYVLFLEWMRAQPEAAPQADKAAP